MYLFKAKQAAAAELDRACAEHGVSIDELRAFLAATPRFASPLHKAPHRYAGTAADLVAQAAPYMTRSRAARWRGRLGKMMERSGDAAQKAPHLVVALVKNAAAAAPDMAMRIKQDLSLYRELRRSKRAPSGGVLDAAAE
ncbi:MAG: 2-hydroxyglutaryl-CoA dehydratase, partial [Myxococcales bacterium]|nr:2-hydroxyglutaryl-CoA dehydratase [Myxococcales bacterium]